MKMVALLRGINVGGNRKIPMITLCEVAEKAGFTDVKSYIQSGNLVFDAGKMKPEKVTVTLEAAIEKFFGFAVEVIVRTEKQWKTYASGSPFSSAEKARPNLLHIGLSKLPPNKDVATAIATRATAGEKVKPVNDAIWADFPKGVGSSRLTPGVFDKAAGSTVTMRNWKTVQKIFEMLRED